MKDDSDRSICVYDHDGNVAAVLKPGTMVDVSSSANDGWNWSSDELEIYLCLIWDEDQLCWRLK